MTMHLEGPWLSKVGKRKGKVKFRNSEQAKRHRELEQEWDKKQKEWKSMSKSFEAKKPSTVPANKTEPYRRDSNSHIPSLNSWTTGSVSTKAIPTYTGDKLVGISLRHKSGLEPVFSEEQAVALAQMRR